MFAVVVDDVSKGLQDMTLLMAVDSALVVDGDRHVTVKTSKFRLRAAGVDGS
jgi:hypothetical protein